MILRYFRLMLVPFGFTCDPDIPIVRDWRGWAAWAALVAIAAVIWRLHAHGKWFVAGLILLAPSSSIFPAEDLSADRRLYLPMVAFAGFAGLSLQALSRRAALIPAAIGLAALCANRSLVWRSEERLWAEAAERAPKKVRPQIFLSRAAGVDAALGILEAVHTQAPHDPRPLVEKGLRLLAVNRPERAAWELQRALELAPDDAPALNNYGAALAMLGKREAAIEQFRHALRLDPCSPTPRKNLALLGITDVLPCP